MSTDLDLVPDWAKAVPNAPVNDPPAQVGGGWSAPMTWQQVLATVEFFLTSFIGQIAIALGGIEIFGWKPLDFLAEWGQDLIDQASNAYLTATGAQSTANTAQTNATSALSQIGNLIFGLLNDPMDFIGTLAQSAIDGLEGALSFLTSNLANAAASLASLINSLLSNAATVIGSIPQSLVSGLSGILSTLSSGVSGAISFVQGIIDAIVSALRGIPIIGAFIPDVQQALTDDKVQQQNFTISAIVSDYRNPSWVCRYPVADVSFPEFMINRTDVFGVTDTASTGTAHTHTGSLTNSMYAVVAGRGIAAGDSRGVYITVSNTTVFDTIMLFVWRAAGTFTGTVTSDVFRERDDGSLYRIFSQDITSQITTTSTFIEYTLPDLIVAQAGEKYLIRIYNNSSLGLFAAAMIETSGAQQQGFYYGLADAPLNSATTFTAAQAVTAQANTSTIHWAALAQATMTPTDRSFSDDANRGAIGGLWFRKSSSASLMDVYEEQFGYTSSTDGSQSSIYIHPTNRDVARVEANLYFNTSSTARQGVLLSCNRDLSQVVYLGVNGTSAKIYSGSHTSLTERASLTIANDDSLWTMYYDSGNDKYVALKDGAVIGLQWTGVSTAVLHGSDYRYGGIRIETAAAQPAGTVDNWTLRDWLIAVPATVNAAVMAASAALVAPAVGAGGTVTAVAMTATAAGVAPVVSAEANIAVPAMAATAAMAAPSTSDNSKFPYQFPYNLT